MFPAEFPHDLRAKCKLVGEKLVYDALRAGLDDTWSVFYNRPVHGTMRRVDFVAIDPARAAVAIEVKGGLVHASRGVFSGPRRRHQIRSRYRGSTLSPCRAQSASVGSPPFDFRCAALTARRNRGHLEKRSAAGKARSAS